MFYLNLLTYFHPLTKTTKYRLLTVIILFYEKHKPYFCGNLPCNDVRL
jgi:hypothetical protein